MLSEHVKTTLMVAYGLGCHLGWTDRRQTLICLL